MPKQSTNDYVKPQPKMLVKKITSVNFINVLRVAFTHADPKIAKKDGQVISLFCAFWDLRA